jgi:hypothetical protein
MCDAIAGVTTADHSSSPSPDLDGVELGRRQRMGLSVSHPRQVRIAVPGLLTLLHQTARGGGGGGACSAHIHAWTHVYTKSLDSTWERSGPCYRVTTTINSHACIPSSSLPSHLTVMFAFPHAICSAPAGALRQRHGCAGLGGACGVVWEGGGICLHRRPGLHHCGQPL